MVFMVNFYISETKKEKEKEKVCHRCHDVLQKVRKIDF
jgi:hypothetical protein